MRAERIALMSIQTMQGIYVHAFQLVASMRNKSPLVEEIIV